MSTAVAAPPVSAPHTTPSVEPSGARAYAAIAPSHSGTHSSTTPNGKSTKPSSHSPPQRALNRTPSDGNGKRSPNSNSGHLPKVIVKEEPSSPDSSSTSSRPRPRRLDLSKNINQVHSAGRPSAPLTSKESAGLALHDVGLACLSPGFNTHDPAMREQLQRSLSVRDQQRRLIEARQHGQKTPHEVGEGSRNGELSGPFGRTPSKPLNTSRRKGPPAGLSIAAPSHEQFANERVIQSAPLHQSFTGLQRNIHPMTRQVVNQPSNLSQTSHIHHVPATQTNNRLPPIADVFPGEMSGSQSSRNTHFNHSPGHSSHSNVQPTLPSPGKSTQQAGGPQSARPREYKSAEEAVQSMTGGREDLLPRIVHYGGHQPPTPPSPMPKTAGLGVSSHGDLQRSGSSRRRDRDEYERDAGSPPLGRGPLQRRGPFGEGRDSPDTQRRKKDEFIQLCARAWDLFHS